MELEKWIKAIPESQVHGSGTLQKRLWRLTSDYVRIRDWYAHNGLCVATGRKIAHWSEGQAGHFKAYSVCNGIFKFDPINIHMQAASSNSWGTSDDWFSYEEEILKRHGTTRAEINELNRLTSLKTLGVQTLKEQMLRILTLIAHLPEQPDYFPRVKMLLTLNAKPTD